MKTLEELKDAIAPLRRGKWVASVVTNPVTIALRRGSDTPLFDAIEAHANQAVDEAVVACFLAMCGAPAAPTALEALKYIDSWIDNKLTMNLVPAARWALEDEMRVHIRAAIERLENGGQLRATTPVGDFER